MDDRIKDQLAGFPRGFNSGSLKGLLKGFERDEDKSLQDDSIEFLRVAYGDDLIDRLPEKVRGNVCAKAVVLFNVMNGMNEDPKYSFKFMDLILGSVIAFCDPLGDISIPDAI